MDRKKLISDNFNREKTRKIKFFSKQIYCIPSYVHFDNYVHFDLYVHFDNFGELHCVSLFSLGASSAQSSRRNQFGKGQ